MLGVNPKHILWTLLFLTLYDTEHNSAQRLGNVVGKTYPKWSELFVIVISYLECEVVSTHPDNASPQREYCTLANLSLVISYSHRLYGTIDFLAIVATRHW